MRDAGAFAYTMKALLPLAWVYGAGVALDRRARRVPKLGAAVQPRVVSVGNLEAGGNGKTPLAMLLIARATARGSRVAYVSRGYGGHSVGAQTVACIFPPNAAPASFTGVRVLTPTHPDLACEIGDEGAVVASRAPLAALFFCTDKTRAVEAAVNCHVDCIILDDAFQSWTVARHTDIVLLDAERPLDGGHLLPAGRLRESPRALARADAVVMNGAATLAELDAARERVGKWLRVGIPVAGLVRRLSFVSADGGGTALPERLLAVSSIARPEAFQRALTAAGACIVAHETFPDHHRYRQRDVERIMARTERERAAIVTTEKDWVKLRSFGLRAPVWIARLDVTLIGDELPDV